MNNRSSKLTPATRPRVDVFLALIKFRLLSLVLVSTCMGFYLSYTSATELFKLLYVLLGVGLVGGGANALNQWWERDADALMLRTRTRPLVTGLISPEATLVFGCSITLAGFLVIGLLVNMLTLLLSFLSWFSYLFLYTPLKVRTPVNTWIGAVPGALPAVLGCTAASGVLDSTALALFLLLYFWQLPHFLAISWVYREDYVRGGFKMLSWNDNQGRTTARHILVNASVLIPVSMGLFFSGGTGLVYLVVAFVASVLQLYFALRFYQQVSTALAKKVFYYSIIYLPVLFIGIVIDNSLALF